MPRKPRIEMPGGLYHVISRGNNRRKVFRTSADYERFTGIMNAQKSKLPFYMYAYCLMPNHIHLLIERREDSVSKIMQRVLTTYSQYHNRKYKKIGHVFQGRYKSILCQTDEYLGELVRYIHLNPVRARMVRQPEDYEYSGHRAYIGLDGNGLVDVEPVLRHFGGTKRRAVEVYRRFVQVGTGHKSREEYYRASEGRMLGSEEFVKEVKHRVGEPAASVKATTAISLTDLLKTAERVSFRSNTHKRCERTFFASAMVSCQVSLPSPGLFSAVPRVPRRRVRTGPGFFPAAISCIQRHHGRSAWGGLRFPAAKHNPEPFECSNPPSIPMGK
jgi:putative transposase